MAEAMTTRERAAFETARSIGILHALVPMVKDRCSVTLHKMAMLADMACALVTKFDVAQMLEMHEGIDDLGRLRQLKEMLSLGELLVISLMQEPVLSVVLRELAKLAKLQLSFCKDVLVEWADEENESEEEAEEDAIVVEPPARPQPKRSAATREHKMASKKARLQGTRLPTLLPEKPCSCQPVK